jgi:hypothetical protein
MDVAGLFAGRNDALVIHNAVQDAIAGIGPTEMRVSKSQVAFYRNHPFAATWMPGKYLRREKAPLVLSIFLKRRDSSTRWKEVVAPAAGRFTHHVELKAAADVDEFIRQCLKEAWEGAV